MTKGGLTNTIEGGLGPDSWKGYDARDGSHGENVRYSTPHTWNSLLPWALLSRSIAPSCFHLSIFCNACDLEMTNSPLARRLHRHVTWRNGRMDVDRVHR